jgi:hypothetical protein
MYRTKLGDCFLLCFPRAKTQGLSADGDRGRAFVLIDCGVFKGTRDGANRIGLIAESIRRATHDNANGKGNGKSRLDLLVITHEHWDHLSGFHHSQARKTFEQFEVGEVWLPWTENHAEPLARELRHLREHAVAALRLAYDRMAEQDVGADGYRARVKSMLLGAGYDPDHFDRNDGSGQVLQWIKDHFRDKVRFKRPGPGARDVDTLPGLPGVRFFVLGPPMDSALIRRLNPRENDDESYSKTKGMASAYFGAFGVSLDIGEADECSAAERARFAEEQRRRSRPFGEVHSMNLKLARRTDFFKRVYLDKRHEWRLIDTEWLAAAGQIALNVDGLANNSSLVLAIELSSDGRVLLFAADAQIGSWLSWGGKVPYPGGEYRGKDMVWKLDDGREVNAKDLLARTVLYKVGHHGSRNGTLKRGGLEVMGTRWPDEFVAMLPVDENLARNHTSYGEMPLTAIVKELIKRTGGRLLRSDEGDGPEEHPKNPSLEPTIGPMRDPGLVERDKSHFPNRSDDPGPDNLYFDYTIASDHRANPA